MEKIREQSIDLDQTAGSNSESPWIPSCLQAQMCVLAGVHAGWWVCVCSSPWIYLLISEPQWYLLTSRSLCSQESEKLAYLPGDSMQSAVSRVQRHSPEG